jgi:hypothetical protein
MGTKRHSLTQYLNKYFDIQKEILLVSHPYRDSNWADRCLFLSEEYNPETPYNHRTMLRQEVVIEFDDKESSVNLAAAKEVAKRLEADQIEYSMWHSGNRSYHVHFFIEPSNAGHLSLLKNITVRHYTEGLQLPDLQLCSDGHLIRAEFGVHEKTGKRKSLYKETTEYPKVCRLPGAVWDKYVKAATTVVKREMTKHVSGITGLKGFKYVVTASEFRGTDDGRERALFMLIHALKPQYQGRKEELTRFLQEWYRYSGGRQLNDEAVSRKVAYHWTRDYRIGQRYLNELLESLGRADLIEKE